MVFVWYRKQWPRNRHRLETSQFNNLPKSYGQSYRHDKQPRNNFENKRVGTYDTDGNERNSELSNVLDTCPSSSLNYVNNANNVVDLGNLPRSKKQNLKHLLNFTYAPYTRSDSISYVRKNKDYCGIVKKKYNKEQFLQASCQFVIRDVHNVASYIICPDSMVNWDFIEQIHFQSSEEPHCPICLFNPVAGKMTKCGHVYCWPCILHYLALSDKTWRKCPICYEAVHVDDLKSVILKPHQSYTIGEFVNLQLMCREKSSLNISKARKPIKSFPHLFGDAEEIKHAKIILADTNEIMTIIERERNELLIQMNENSKDCPESIFIQQSLRLLQKRENKLQITIEEKFLKLEKSMNNLSVHAGQFVLTKRDSITAKAKLSETYSFHINESNLTLNDINFTPDFDDSNCFYFYQSADGQKLYMHSVNIRMLQMQYGCLAEAPEMIRGKIVHKESCSMTEDLRKRLKYLQHLPVTSQFDVVEITFDKSIISDEVFDIFLDELDRRQKNRQRKVKKELKREKIINEANERQIGNFLERTANIHARSNPLCGNIATPLLNNELHIDKTPSTSFSAKNNSASRSFADMVTESNKEKQFWPTLGLTGKNVTSALVETISKPSSYRLKYLSESSDSSNYLDNETVKAPPEYKLSFLNACVGNSHVADASNKRGKKKKKKTILFSTGGPSFIGS